jgi:hypothetical protein
MRMPFPLIAALALTACGGRSDSGGISGGGTLNGIAEQEPNGTTGEAQPMTLGTAIAATISSGADVDDYRLEIPAGGATVRIRTSDASGTACAAIDPDFLVLRSDGTTFVWAVTSGCGDYTGGLAAGTWYIQVTGRAAFSYVLHVRTAGGPEVSESEPNDDGATAQLTLDFDPGAAGGPFTAPTVVAGAIDTRGDDDFYAVRNAKAYPVLVHLQTYATWDGAIGTCPFPTDPTLDLYLADGTLAVHRDYHGISSDCEPLEYELAAGATIYVRVTGHGDVEYVPAYRLLIDL